MKIDKGFYSVNQISMGLNSPNNEPKQDFSQILTQTIQKQETQSQAKLSGDAWQDWQNGLISFDEYELIDFTMDGAQLVAGYRVAWQKTGKEPIDDFDINFDEYGGRVKQKEILTNGSKNEKERWLNSYKQVLEEGSVMPTDPRALGKTIDYINRVLNGL